MKQVFNRQSFIAVPFLLGLFFFAGLMTANAVTLFGVTTANQLMQFDRLGTKSFLTVQNDYDGDGKTDVAVYNPNNGFIYVRRSFDGGLTQVQFGQSGDYPIANYDTH